MRYVAKKSFGQNFLGDQNHLAIIARHIQGVCAHNPVMVELGAGTGFLTRALLEKHLKIYALERDRDLIPLLQGSFETEIKKGELSLLEANAVTYDYASLLGENQKLVLCGNLPYHLTSMLLFRSLELRAVLEGAVFLVQKEVAERLVAKPHTKNYGFLSIAMQAAFSIQYVHEVPRHAFSPIPKVDGGVVILLPDGEHHLSDQALGDLIEIARKAFQKRRKTLKNALSFIPNIEEKLQRLNIETTLRPENLSVQDFIRIAQPVDDIHLD